MKTSSISVLVPPSQPIIDFEILPFANTHIDILKSTEYMLCLLLRNLKSFHIRVKFARSKMGLTNFLTFPSDATLESLLDLEYKFLSEDQRSVLRKEIDNVLSSYKLGQNWRLSISTVILTYHLPIPYPIFGVQVHFPTKERVRVLGLIRQNEVVQYPAIYLTSRTSSTKLIKWIKNNKKTIDTMNTYLPSETNVASRLDIRTERIAVVATIFKQDGQHKWAKMEKIIEEWAKKEEDNLEGYFGKEGTPIAEDLRTCYKSYMLLLHKLEGSSES